MIVTGPEVVRWVAKQTNEFGNFGTDVGIGWEKDGRLVAGVAYANWNGPNVECHIASDGSKQWLDRRFLAVIFDYPFNQLKCKRITVCIGEGNLPSRRFVEKLGFKHWTTLGADSHPTGELLVGWMYRSECRWIGPDFEKRISKAA